VIGPLNEANNGLPLEPGALSSVVNGILLYLLHTPFGVKV
jgi:hypothetical protein